MILWRSAIEREPPVAPGLVRRAWRWVAQVGWCYVDLHHEVRFGERDWGLAVRYYRADITSRFAFGSRHTYYNGPHCQFSLGWLHFSWSPRARCAQCEPEDC
jgi:hypothetical protein